MVAPGVLVVSVKICAPFWAPLLAVALVVGETALGVIGPVLTPPPPPQPRSKLLDNRIAVLTAAWIRISRCLPFPANQSALTPPHP